jgi:hypothetical protein
MKAANKLIYRRYTMRIQLANVSFTYKIFLWGELSAYSTDVSRFQRTISDREDADHLKDFPNKMLTRIIKAMTSIKQAGYILDTPFARFEQIFKQYDIAGSVVNEITEVVRTSVTPAGPFHLAMMFGPLIFESGVRK